MRRVQKRQVDRKIISSTETPRKFTKWAAQQDVQGCCWATTEETSSHPASLWPRVRTTSLTSWALSCPLGLSLPSLPHTELCPATRGRGAVAVADRIGVKFPLGTPSPQARARRGCCLGKQRCEAPERSGAAVLCPRRALARSRAHSQQLLVGPLLVRLVADIGDVDREVVGRVVMHDVAHVRDDDVLLHPPF